MKAISTIIVDDEPLALRGLELRLSKFPDIRIVERCKNGREAIKAVKALKPELVFLDIQMPGFNGFDVIKALVDIEPPIFVFVTAFDRYAVDAFEKHVFDYLLKPVDDARLSIAISRVRNQLNQKLSLEHNTRLLELIKSVNNKIELPGQFSERVSPQYESRISIKSTHETTLLDVEKIEWIDAAGDYLCLHAGGETHILRETMKRMMQRLDPAKFLRIHRSAIVNIHQISKLTSGSNGQYSLILKNGNELKIGRHYKDILARFL